MIILDVTASVRSMWYQKHHNKVVYFDKRNGLYSEGGKGCDDTNRITPTIQGVWQNLPFKNDVFDIVVYDPPHLFKSDEFKKRPSMCSRYGYFILTSWRGIMEAGILELFRVLKPNGIFIFKWCECDKSIDEVLKLFPCEPLFGTRTGNSNTNHWITFLKEKQPTFEDYA